MLNLNIKSSSYMCLDINPDSVIHKHLTTKFENKCLKTLDRTCNPPTFKPNSNNIWKLASSTEDNYHNLTMLPSFHISLGAPPPNSETSIETVKLEQHEFHELVEIISLADIHVSERENKKSAWISINDVKFSLATRIIPFSYMHSEDLHLHISLANLTGNPRDSIARPEDCIIDTITA